MKIKDQYNLLKQVFEEGKTLQFLNHNNEWEDVNSDNEGVAWVGKDCSYRIKPEPRKFWIKEISGATRPFHKNDDKKQLELLGWVLYEQVE